MRPNYEKLTKDEGSNATKSKAPPWNKVGIAWMISVIILFSQGLIILSIKLCIKDQVISQLTQQIKADGIKLSLPSLDSKEKAIKLNLDSVPSQREASMHYQTALYEHLGQIKVMNHHLSLQLKTKNTEKERLKTMSSVLSFKQMKQVESWTKCTFDPACYRMIRDSFSAKLFHARCDQLKPTVTIIQADKSILFGGFTYQSWDGKELKYDNKAFLFSLYLDKVFNIRFNMVAIRTSPDLLPTFGEKDIYISENESYTFDTLRSYQVDQTNLSFDKEYYDRIDFRIINIEVFPMKCPDTN